LQNIKNERSESVDNKAIKNAIIFFAKLIFRLERQGKIYLTNNEYIIIEHLLNGDFSAFDKEE